MNDSQQAGRTGTTPRFPWLTPRECDRCGYTFALDQTLSVAQLRRAATAQMTRKAADLISDADLWGVSLLCRHCALEVTQRAATGRYTYGPDHPMRWAARQIAWLEKPQRPRARDVLTATAAACDHRTGVTFSAQKTIAAEWAIPPDTFKREQRALREQHGLLHAERRQRRADGTQGTNVLALVGYPALTLVAQHSDLELQVWAPPGLTRELAVPVEDDIPY